MRFLISLAATTAMALTASAAPITTFTSENVKAIVTAAGGTNIKTESTDGVPYVNFDYQGLKYSASIRFCDKGTTKNCQGLLLAIGFEADPADTLETINSFNYGLPMVTAVKPDANTLAFGRFVTSIGGIQDSNVAANLGMLVASPSIYAEFRKTQVVASTGAGATVMLSQNAGPAPALKPVQLTPEQLTGLMKLAPEKLAQ
jgi:hypothetical protein